MEHIMNVFLNQAGYEDCEEIQKMQEKSFAQLLEKYQDFDINPACESLEIIRKKMAQPFTNYYFIISDNTKVGAVRVVTIDESTKRISPIFILPEYQNSGYAKRAMGLIESQNPEVKLWLLDTILQEQKLCHLYESLGYLQTGEYEDIKDGMTIAYYEKRVR